ncbi:hypothetical protein P9112_003634 [Eukaryota sp. TZLM1-RC]
MSFPLDTLVNGPIQKVANHTTHDQVPQFDVSAEMDENFKLPSFSTVQAFVSYMHNNHDAQVQPYSPFSFPSQHVPQAQPHSYAPYVGPQQPVVSQNPHLVQPVPHRSFDPSYNPVNMISRDSLPLVQRIQRPPAYISNFPNPQMNPTYMSPASIPNYGPSHTGEMRPRRSHKFSPEQTAILRNEFEKNPRPSPTDVARIAQQVGLLERQVKVWFQNSRSRRPKKN